MKAIGVLCARVRVEEKQIITAVGHAGAAGIPVPPPSTPMPPGPASLDLATLGIERVTTTADNAVLDGSLTALIDRCQNRTIAAIALPIFRASGVSVLDAGLAADKTRLDVARALAIAGIPRPASLIGFSEASGIEAARRIGFPATLLPLTPGLAGTTLHDADTADAVIEHRVVLGSESVAIILIQEGAPTATERTMVHVVGGQAIAFDGALPDRPTIDVAEQAAHIIEANLVSVELAQINGKTVVWDMHPVADFRQAQLLGPESVAAAITRTAVALAKTGPSTTTAITDAAQRGTGGSTSLTHWEAEVRHDVVLSA